MKEILNGKLRIVASLAALAAGVVLLGCERSPNLDEVATSTKQNLQEQLDTDFGTGNITVEKVNIVRTTVPKYDGIAVLATENTKATIPVAVTSDGKTTLVFIDEKAVRSVIQSSLQKANCRT